MRKNYGFWLLVIVFLVNITFGLGLDWYKKFWFFDVILHFLGGLGVYIVAREYFSKDFRENSWIRYSLLLVGIVMFVGVLWEFTEYNINIVWRARLQNIQVIGDLDDTMKDLAMDMLGGIIGAISHFFWHRKSQKTQTVS